MDDKVIADIICTFERGFTSNRLPTSLNRWALSNGHNWGDSIVVLCPTPKDSEVATLRFSHTFWMIGSHCNHYS